MKKLKQLKTQTNLQYANAISEEFVNQLIKSNVILIKAIDDEDFETAAKIRDYLNDCVESITNQTSIIMDMDIQVLRKHYQEQNQIVFTSMMQEKNKDQINK